MDVSYVYILVNTNMNMFKIGKADIFIRRYSQLKNAWGDFDLNKSYIIECSKNIVFGLETTLQTFVHSYSSKDKIKNDDGYTEFFDIKSLENIPNIITAIKQINPSSHLIIKDIDAVSYFNNSETLDNYYKASSLCDSYVTNRQGSIIYTGTKQEYFPFKKIDSKVLKLMMLSLNKIKQRVKDYKNILNLSHSYACDKVAKELGFKSWSEVREIREKNFDFRIKMLKVEDKFTVYDLTTHKTILETVSPKIAKLHCKEIQEEFNNYGTDLSIYSNCFPVNKNKETLEIFLKDFKDIKTKRIEQLVLQERILSKVTSDYKIKKSKEKIDSIKNSIIKLDQKINEFENEILML